MTGTTKLPSSHTRAGRLRDPAGDLPAAAPRTRQPGGEHAACPPAAHGVADRAEHGRQQQALLQLVHDHLLTSPAGPLSIAEHAVACCAVADAADDGGRSQTLLCIGRAIVHAAHDDMPAALDACSSAEALVQALDLVEMSAYVHGTRGMVLAHCKRHGEAIVALTHAYHFTFSGSLQWLRIRIVAALGELASDIGLATQALRFSSRAVSLLDLFPQPGATPALATAGMAVHLVDVARDRLEAGEPLRAVQPLLDKAIDRCRRFLPATPQVAPAPAEAQLRHALALAHLLAQDLPQARLHSERARVCAVAAGGSSGAGALPMACLAFAEGRLDEAIRCGTAEIERLGERGNQCTRALLARLLARAHAARSDFAAAYRHAQLAAELASKALRQRADGRIVDALGQLDTQRLAHLHYLAHDLRSPVLAMAQAADAGVGHGADCRAQLQVVRRLARRASDLLERTLDFARLGGALTTPKYLVELGEVVQDAQSEFDARWLACGVALQVGALPLVLIEGDATLMLRAISNLLNNAARVTPTGGRVELALEQVGDTAVVRVLDRGPGFDFSRLPRLFGHGDDAHGGGARFGLPLVSLIAEFHNGAAFVDDRMGGGAVVSLLLPVAGG